MLLGIVTVVVLVAGSETDDPATRSMVQALRASLGSDATVIVRAASPGGEDTTDALGVVAAREHASLASVVTWSDHRRRVTVRFARPADRRSGERELVFDGTDASRERGRAVGFAIASMVGDDEPAPESSPPEPAPRPPVVTVAPVTPVARPAETVAPVAPPASATNTSLEACAVAASALDGFGGGGGLTLAFRRELVGAFAFRAAATARFGEVRPASASTRTGIGAVGVSFLPTIDRQRRWAVGARLDALALFQEVVHLSADDEAPVHASRIVPGADLALEGAYRFTPTAAFVAALGGEAAFGNTDVYVHRRLVANLAPFRAVSEIGLRLSF